jgi:hypothetical protein
VVTRPRWTVAAAAAAAGDGPALRFVPWCATVPAHFAAELSTDLWKMYGLSTISEVEILWNFSGWSSGLRFWLKTDQRSLRSPSHLHFYHSETFFFNLKSYFLIAYNIDQII